jgi:uncharacterized protein YndB with AHSA1/START domain
VGEAWCERSRRIIDSFSGMAGDRIAAPAKGLPRVDSNLRRAAHSDPPLSRKGGPDVSDQAAIKATKTKTTFRQECAVSAVISATPEKIWRLLTDADDMVRWNSTLTSVEGAIELGGTVKMRVPEAPGRVFKIRVTTFTPDREMVWADGNPVMFLGVRTYRLTPNANDTTTFEMTEVFSGLMLPMIVGRLPDFQPIFERYAADLKREAEAT